MLGGRPCHCQQLCFLLYFHASGYYLKLFNSSNLKSYLQIKWLEPGVMSVVWPIGVYLLDFFCTGICFISVLCLDLGILGEYARMR